MFQVPSFVQIRLPVQPIGFSERITALLLEEGTQAAINSLLTTTSLGEAIADSSPNLYQSWLESKQGGSLPEEQVQALLRYLFRSLCRATPYGRLAGVGVATLQTPVGLTFQPTPEFAFHQRYDSAVLSRLVAELEADHLVRKQLTYRLNNSLYEVGEQWRFSRRDTGGTGGQVTLLTYTDSDVLRAVVSYMQAHQPVSWRALLDELTARFAKYDPATLEVYAHHLVSQGFLTSSLQIPVTGLPMQVHLRQELVRLGFSSDRLDAFSDQPNHLNKIQTDTAITSDLSVSTSLARQLTHELNALQPLLVSAVSTTLTDFKRRFVRRYEGARVSLLEALDPVYGIQYEVSNRLEESWLNRWPVDNVAPSSGNITPLNMLDYVLSQSKQEVGAEVNLRAYLNKQPLSTSVPLPTAVSVMGEMYVGRSENRSDFRFHLKLFFAPSASRLLGRFCYLSDDLTERVRALNQQEQAHYPAAILAEIAHLPGNRMGNIMARPLLRDWEIPYLTPGGIAQEKTIPVSELLIEVDHQVRLYDRRTGERILPRLSSAHNTTKGDEVYGLLADIMNQERVHVGWDWGPYRGRVFLPRVTLNRLIISRAGWCLKKERHLPLLTDYGQLKAFYRLPRFCLLADRDNELLLDLSLAPMQRYLWKRFCQDSEVSLVEWLHDTLKPNYKAWYQTGEGDAYVSEWVIPLVKTLPNTSEASRPGEAVSTVRIPQRQFEPGSEWLYLRVYASEVAQEEVIEHLKPLLDRQGLFFFVRYADPEPHLRLRWQILPAHFARRYRSIRHRLSPLLESRLIHRLDLGTYERELERYGGDSITMWEQVFGADSTVFRRWLNGVKSHQRFATDEERYRYGILQVGRLLDAVGLSLQARKTLLTGMQQSFLREKPKPTELKKVLNEQYRRYSNQIFRPADDSEQRRSEEFVTLLTPILPQLQMYGQQVELALAEGTITPPVNALTGAIHMSMNRLFLSEARSHELVVYHFMVRHLSSLVARK